MFGPKVARVSNDKSVTVMDMENAYLLHFSSDLLDSFQEKGQGLTTGIHYPKAPHPRKAKRGSQMPSTA